MNVCPVARFLPRKGSRALAQVTVMKPVQFQAHEVVWIWDDPHHQTTLLQQQQRQQQIIIMMLVCCCYSISSSVAKFISIVECLIYLFIGLNLYNEKSII